MEKYNLLKNKDKAESGEIKEPTGRRSYSLAYKRKILQKAKECKAMGELAALLRREGLASSTLNGWRQKEANDDLRATDAPRGPKKSLSNTKANRLKNLERENYKLKKRIERAEALLDLQKKIAVLMNEETAKSKGNK